MERIPVQSSNVAEVGYEAYSMLLEVAFVSGSVYQYFDVPEAVYQELLRASSVGKFLNEHIKGSYRYARL